LTDDSPPTRSKIIPIFSMGRDWWTRPYVIPAAATFITYIALLYFENRTSTALEMLLNQQSAVTVYVNATIHFGIAIGFYIGFLIFYLMMTSTERQKPWWIVGAVALATAIIISSPLWKLIDQPFIALLGGSRFGGDTVTPLTVFASIVQIGLPEELSKAIPLLILAWLTTRLSPALAAKIGLRNPLDGIVFAMASALGFTFVETFTEYAPKVYRDVLTIAPHSAAILGFASTHSLQVLIERIVQSLAGHLGFSGYFGYMIGLAIVNPKYRWQYLLVGWAGAAVLHGLWDAIGVQSLTLSAIFAALTIVMLIGAIRRARRFEGLSVPLAAVRRGAQP
jgi:RsiW-degrading membrane proteinase PrsW (M82 family)